MTLGGFAREEVRDSLLAISGRPDLALGGTTILLREREYVTGTGSRKNRA